MEFQVGVACCCLDIPRDTCIAIVNAETAKTALLRARSRGMLPCYRCGLQFLHCGGERAVFSNPAIHARYRVELPDGVRFAADWRAVMRACCTGYKASNQLIAAFDVGICSAGVEQARDVCHVQALADGKVTCTFDYWALSAGKHKTPWHARKLVPSVPGKPVADAEFFAFVRDGRLVLTASSAAPAHTIDTSLECDLRTCGTMRAWVAAGMPCSFADLKLSPLSVQLATGKERDGANICIAGRTYLLLQDCPSEILRRLAAALPEGVAAWEWMAVSATVRRIVRDPTQETV